jgi:hypothetical protein
MADINPLLVEESIAVHLFVNDKAGSFRWCYDQDKGSLVNYMRTDKHFVAVTDAPSKVVDRILKPIGAWQKIHVMRIVTHGDAGGMFLPGMLTTRFISPEWRRLRSYFDPTARVELHVCGVASETSIIRPGASAAGPRLADVRPGTFSGAKDGVGLTFLRAVAATLGTTVVAGVDFQVVRPNDWDFEHDTVTVAPGGRFHFDSSETRAPGRNTPEEAADKELEMIQSMLIKEKLYPEARTHLAELIRNYPRTRAAQRARVLLNTNFHPPRDANFNLPPLAPD